MKKVDKETAQRITYASQVEVKLYQAEIDELLAVVFNVHGAWVSDLSSCLDFVFVDTQRKEKPWRELIVSVFGIPMPEREALVVDVARSIRAKRMQ